MRERPGKPELPLDVRRRAGSADRDGALVSAVLDALPSPTVLLDPDGIVVMGNKAWTAAGLEHGAPILAGADYYTAAVGPHDDPDGRTLVRRLRDLAQGGCSEVSVDRAMPSPLDGTPRWYRVQATRVDQAGHVVVTHTDVTARVLAERAATWRARHDQLTELPNRTHLHELIDAELQRPDRRPLSVIFLDVDGFKEVNDSLGHELGDSLLRQMAGRLTSGTRGQDTVGRLGGDEFVVICRDCGPDGAEILADRFQSALTKPFDLGGRVVRLSASIGIAGVHRSRSGSVRSTDLVRDADLAMYAAKAAGRNRVRVFDPVLRTAAQLKMQLGSELRDAIDSDQLVLHYQPVVHLPSGEASGVEALVRWQHPERGLLAPSEFVPLAEQHDLIAPLTRWVLRTATRQAVAWDAAGLPPLIMGVNISAAHFAAGTLVDDVMSALAESDLPPERLIVELTETSVAEDPLRAAAQLAELRISGVEVSIDDFGSGFSSLSQLLSLPAGVLKIDRSLVVGVDGQASQSAAAIAAVVGLGNAFGMRSLAEGVETDEQLAVATELGCTFAQGYLIARPMPADAVLRWMRDGAGQPATTPSVARR